MLQVLQDPQGAPEFGDANVGFFILKLHASKSYPFESRVRYGH